MSLPKTAADVLADHIELEVESLDRIYLNVIQHRLQAENGIAYFFRHHRGEAFATAKVMSDVTKPFVKDIEDFAASHAVPLIGFGKGQRKEELAKDALESFPDREGVLFIGKAQEKAYVVRTITKKNPDTGRTYPWLIKSSAMVNHYYFYRVDEDFVRRSPVCIASSVNLRPKPGAAAPDQLANASHFSFASVRTSRATQSFV